MSTQGALIFLFFYDIMEKIDWENKEMNSEERRLLIMKRLQQSREPVSANCLAKEFCVTRQIIVADIALLRAAGAWMIREESRPTDQRTRDYLRERLENSAQAFKK